MILRLLSLQVVLCFLCLLLLFQLFCCFLNFSNLHLHLPISVPLPSSIKHGHLIISVFLIHFFIELFLNYGLCHMICGPYFYEDCVFQALNRDKCRIA